MYPLRYVTSAGSLQMGHPTPYLIKSVSGLSGVEVSMSLSQGFSQVGETIDAMSVGGIDITVDGFINPASGAQVAKLVDLIAPLSTGRLYLHDFWMDVAVKNAPLIAQSLRKANFNFRLFAPYPYWRHATPSVYHLGMIAGGFTFPVTSLSPHTFGYRSTSAFTNCYNAGAIDADFRMLFYAYASLSGITVLNVTTREFVRINVDMALGDRIELYRENNQLRLVQYRGGEQTDIFSAFDDESTLFYMHAGDNVLSASADESPDNLGVRIEFYPAKTGAFYGM